MCKTNSFKLLTTPQEGQKSVEHRSPMRSITPTQSQSPRDWSQLFFWLPALVHYAVVLLPFSIVAVVYFLVGMKGAFIYTGGALAWLLRSSLYPGEKIKTGPHTKCTRGRHKPVVARVAVIGGGPAGIVTAKELLEAGHRVDLYDVFPRLGGEFENRFYPKGKLTSSPYVTAFSDYEPKDPETGNEHFQHHTKEEYSQYLNAYAKEFGVSDATHHETRVEKVYKDSNPQGDDIYFLEVTDLASGSSRKVGPFNHVAVCIGSHSPKSSSRSIAGLEGFEGNIIHTSDFWKRSKDDADKGYQDVAGKRIVTVGLGEGMADILHIITTITNPPTAIESSVRGGVFIIPRVNPLNNMNNDFDSTRLRYAIPKSLHSLSIMVCSKLTKYFSLTKHSNPQRDVRFSLLERLKFGAAFVRSTKSDSFVPDVVASKIRLRPGIDHTNGNTCYFVDGTKMENVDTIVLGTGFDISEKNFPFLMDLPTVPAVSPVDRLFRMFDPNFGASICFIGAGIRPLVGSIPTICEIQARLFARIVSGKRELPSREEMKELINVAKEEARQDLSRGNEKWKGVVNWIPYMDSIALEIGCLPSICFLLTRPSLWFKVLVGPMCSFHYRLCGPGSEGKDKAAEDIIMRLPIGTRKRDLLFFAGINTTVSLITWPFNLVRLILNWLARATLSFSGNFSRQGISSVGRSIATPGNPGLRQSISITDKFHLGNNAFLALLGKCGWIRHRRSPVKSEINTIVQTARRPPVVNVPNAEKWLKGDPDVAMNDARKEYGDVFRFDTSSGKSTVMILDKQMADQALKCKSISFFHASYQSKIRFGIKKIVQSPKDVQKLTAFFQRTLAGTKNTKAFTDRFIAFFDDRLKEFVSGLPEVSEGSPSSVCMSLQSIVGKLFFAANLDTLFGEGFYSPELYDDFLIFDAGMGGRSASGSNNTKSSVNEQKEEAAARIQAKIRRFREQRMARDGYHGILQEIPIKLKADEEESDRLTLLLFWAANVNMMPTTAWVLATILKYPKLHQSLRRERNGDSDARPKLTATIAEVFRIRSGANMYRVVTDDVDIGGFGGKDLFHLKAGEWVWLYPRAYLHHNDEEYVCPKKFDEDRFVDKCPFKTSFSGLRPFGGGVAPCPGSQYSVMMLESVVESFLLSEALDIRLHHPDRPLPGAQFDTVSSTPPPCEEILVDVARNYAGKNKHL